MPIIAIRPEPGCSATVEAGRKAGLAIEGWPSFEIRPLAWAGPDPAGIDGLLLGSANAVRCGGDMLARYRDKPVWAVGPATAEAARAAGFTIAAEGEGVLQQVVDRIERPMRLLRPTGVEHVGLRLPAHIEVVIRIGYESRPLPFPPTLARRLPGALVLLHSAAAARHFAGEIDRLGVPRAELRLAALGPRIEAAAGKGWLETRSAAAPSDDELLALVAEMCHDLARRGG